MKMENPLVSILTVTRNRGSLISRCIKSIQAQTYTNFEHIIVDGASTDNTEEVVMSFNDSRIKFVKLEENLSIHESYRKGLEIAHGDYFCILDDDDEYLPTKIEKQLALLESLPDEYGFVVCWMTYIDAVTKKVLKIHSPQVKGYVLPDILEEPVISGTPTFFFKMNVFKERFDDIRDSGLSSDWVTGAKYCEKWKVDYVPESLINVYVNHGSTRMSETNKYYEDHWLRDVKFADYFLTTYKDIYDKTPSKKKNHLTKKMIALFMLGRFSEGRAVYKELLVSDFTLKNIFRPIKCYLDYLKYGRNKQKKQ